MRKYLIVFFLTFFLSFSSSSYAQTTCDERLGSVSRETYASQILGRTMYYTVYLPPCYYQNDEAYPVIYLMHGSNEDDGQWERLYLSHWMNVGIRDGVVAPAIVIMPFGDFIANEIRFDAYSWPQVFIDELLPVTEMRYRIVDNRDYRAIGGISRGGFWAYYIAMKYPDLFSIVGGHSAFFDMGQLPQEDDPRALVQTAERLETMRFFLDRGADDYAAPGLDWMNERMLQRGLNLQYTVYPEGEHQNTYWRAHVSEYLALYTQDWPKQSPYMRPVISEGASRYSFFVPAVAFPSLKTTITQSQLQAVWGGAADDTLVLSRSVAHTLYEYGFILHPAIQLVADDALESVLWRQRNLYTLLPFTVLNTRLRILLVDGVHPVDYLPEQYPLAFVPLDETTAYSPDFLTRFTLSGVTALARGTRAALQERGVAWAIGDILPYVLQTDFFHMSSEVSFHPDCPDAAEDNIGGVISFCAMDDHFSLFTALGVDVVELSGNHNNDYGFDAYLRTLAMFHENGIATVGGGDALLAARQPFIVAHHQNTVALIACNWAGPDIALVNENVGRPGAAYCDMAWLREAIPSLSSDYDVVIVSVQYQEVEEYTPTDKQRLDFRELASLGADVVIGTQAHKPQTFEFFSDNSHQAFIHYGLGNLFFDQEFWGNRRFFMDTLYIYQGRLLTVDLFTGIIEEQARPRPMTPEERETFLQFMFIQQNGF